MPDNDFATVNSLSATAASTAALPLSSGAWTLDPLHSAVNFTIRHLGIAKVRGRFTEVEAGLYVGNTLADVQVTATVSLASIDTGNADRDAHTRSADLLDVERRPTMAFRSTGVSGADEDWSMAGELTIGDVTRPVTLDVEFGGLVDVPMDGSRHAGFEATGEIRRSDFGLDFGTGLLGDVVKIQLDMQFVEPREPQDQAG
ncbi:YceI family protein [Streptomyces sp. VRA16 Mangrove soil]|uniref:YceI family protein n=1 Tax=Streptomyces sp. VRA16 Mangrove soil TaxID=2817434 RepID=UPI001A9FFD78|nr:YceI family protein [Streptomyces sp. VRA16 Mangrove soil]MBO1335338.1 YceI family protein [Streptomyces sp. VRA16 Mangrove soil]